MSKKIVKKFLEEVGRFIDIVFENRLKEYYLEILMDTKDYVLVVISGNMVKPIELARRHVIVKNFFQMKAMKCKVIYQIDSPSGGIKEMSKVFALKRGDIISSLEYLLNPFIIRSLTIVVSSDELAANITKAADRIERNLLVRYLREREKPISLNLLRKRGFLRRLMKFFMVVLGGIHG